MSQFNPNDPYQKAQMNALANLYDQMTSRMYNDDTPIPGDIRNYNPFGTRGTDIEAEIKPRPDDGSLRDLTRPEDLQRVIQGNAGYKNVPGTYGREGLVQGPGDGQTYFPGNGNAIWMSKYSGRDI